MDIRKATPADLRPIAELAMMGIADALAVAAGCELLSIEVFEQNRGAVRLYRKLGYSVTEKRPVVSHPCHPYTGELILLTKPVGEVAGNPLSR